MSKYTPDEIAQAYGVTVEDPCPIVKIEFPSWAVESQAKGEFDA